MVDAKKQEFTEKTTIGDLSPCLFSLMVDAKKKQSNDCTKNLLKKQEL